MKTLKKLLNDLSSIHPFKSCFNTEIVSFYPSKVDDWTLEDKSYLLKGKMYYPANFNDKEVYPALILFHGLHGKRRNSDVIARNLASKGVICFAIDFHGHGKSGGIFPFESPELYNATFPDSIGAYRYLTEKSFINKSSIASFGQSLGGGAALYLALEDLTPKFVAWYPGSAYVYGDIPLYQSISTSDDFKGLIIQGTKDGCIRCKPEFTQNFVDLNAPNIELNWIEGGTHGTGVDRSTYIANTLNWFYKLWKLN